MENKIIKNIGKKRIIFYIITIILNIISWYYVSCFCAVYINTQKHILYDFLYGIPMSIGSCLLDSLFNSLLKVIIIKGNYSKVKKFILNILNNNFISFILEKLVEYLIIKLIMK